MKTQLNLLLLVLLTISTSCVLSTTTTIYVAPDAQTPPKQCGRIASTPCGSIHDALDSFADYSFPASGNPPKYPPVILALAEGIYFASATSKNVSDQFSFYQYDVTIQPAAQGDVVTMSGEFFANILFNIGLSKPDNWGASLTLNNIIFNSFTQYSIIGVSAVYDTRIYLSGCTFINCQPPPSSSSPYSILSYGHGNPTIINIDKTTVNNTKAGNNAGASFISAQSSTLTISNSFFNNNEGVLVLSSSAQTTISNTLFQGNQQAISQIFGNMTIIGSNFNNNQGTNSVVNSKSGGISIATTNFNGNSLESSQNAGIVYTSGTWDYYFNISGSNFKNNMGTPVFSQQNTLGIKSTTFQNNQGYFGGGFYQTLTSVDVQNSYFFVSSSNLNNLNEMIYLNKVPSMSISGTTFQVSNGLQGISSSLAMIECQSSSVYLNGITMNLPSPYRSLDCSQCNVVVNSGTEYDCQASPTGSSTSQTSISVTTSGGSSSGPSTTGGGSSTTGGSTSSSTTTGSGSGSGSGSSTTGGRTSSTGNTIITSSTSSSSTTSSTTGGDDHRGGSPEIWKIGVGVAVAILVVSVIIIIVVVVVKKKK